MSVSIYKNDLSMYKGNSKTETLASTDLWWIINSIKIRSGNIEFLKR